AERAKSGKACIGGADFTSDELGILHKSIIAAIGDTVRYGYSNSGGVEVIGTQQEPIVEVKPHIDFVNALFRNRANLQSRSRLSFFTTNYDTLLEDALAFEKYRVIDGFSGGAVGYWNAYKEFSQAQKDPETCTLYKL